MIAEETLVNVDVARKDRRRERGVEFVRWSALAEDPSLRESLPESECPVHPEMGSCIILDPAPHRDVCDRALCSFSIAKIVEDTRCHRGEPAEVTDTDAQRREEERQRAALVAELRDQEADAREKRLRVMPPVLADRIDELRRCYSILESKFAALEARCDQLAQRVEELEKENEEHKRHIAALQAKGQSHE